MTPQGRDPGRDGAPPASRGGGRAPASLIVRAGDFFGPRAGNNWFSQGLVKPGTASRRRSAYPGAPGVGHQWAYLPDVAETMARLVEARGPARPSRRFHMDGHWDADGTAMVAAIRRGGRPARCRRAASPGAWCGSPRRSCRCSASSREMRYLWKQPLRMPNDRLVAAIGPEPRTPLDVAVAETLAGLGCLPRAGRRPSGSGIRQGHAAPVAGNRRAGIGRKPHEGEGGERRDDRHHQKGDVEVAGA